MSLVPKFLYEHPCSGVRDREDMILGEEVVSFEIVTHPFCDLFGHEGNLCIFP